MSISEKAWTFGEDFVTEILKGVKENAVISGIAFVSLLGGATAYRIYWSDPWFFIWPETAEEWSEREVLVSMLIDSANRLMIACAYFERDKSTNSLLCLKVGSARLLAAFYWKAASRMRSSFSLRVRAKLTESFCKFSAIFEKMKIHPHMQLLIGEASIGEASSLKTSSVLHDEIVEAEKHPSLLNASPTPMSALKCLSSASWEDIKHLKELCESLLKELDPKKFRWISAEDIKWHSRVFAANIIEEKQGLATLLVEESRIKEAFAGDCRSD